MTSALQVYPLIAVKAPNGSKMLIASHEYDPTKHKAWKEDKQAQKEADEAASVGAGPSDEDGHKDTGKMNKDELVAYAAHNQIDLQGASSKTDIAKRVEAWKESNGVK